MDKQKKDLANRVLLARKAKRLSQYALAEAAGLSRGTIANIELANTGDVQWETLKRIAKALDVPASYLTEALETTEDARGIVERFLGSAIGLAAEPTESEVQWLRSLPEISWLGDAPTEKTIFYMLQALRERDHAATDEPQP